EMEAIPVESKDQTASVSAPQAEPEDHEIKARVDAVWQKMNKGVSTNTLNSIVNKHTPNGNKAPQTDKASNVTEFRDFAGEEIEVKKMVDPSSKEAAERAKAQAGPSSVVDSVLEQIKKKPKLSLLDKTKKDWGEFKGENKDYEEELDAYKKSSNQYLDKVSFLSRADYREFERERDVRLAQQAKRKPDMREGP
uniref:BCNT-C domain-containing protein n=1 Tax=Chenopodium quinoa TaxID=63459 RepID=A0A803LXT3_CHEQI